MTTEDLQKYLSKQIKKVLVDNNLSAGKFADMLGVTRQAAGRYTNGKASIDNMLYILEGFGYEFDIQVKLKEVSRKDI